MTIGDMDDICKKNKKIFWGGSVCKCVLEGVRERYVEEESTGKVSIGGLRFIHLGLAGTG